MYEWRYLKHKTDGWEIVYVKVDDKGSPIWFKAVGLKGEFWLENETEEVIWGPVVPDHTVWGDKLICLK